MKILIATRNSEVYHTLSGREQIKIVEALSVDRAYESIGHVDLAIIDLPDLVANNKVSPDLLHATIQQQSHVVDSAQFLQSPDTFLQEAGQHKRQSAGWSTQPQIVALVSYAGSGGGVGKTTMSLALAGQFQKQLKRPVLVMEGCYGYSGLSAILSSQQHYPIHTFHDLLSGEKVTTLDKENIDLLAMNIDLDRPHFDRENPERLAMTTRAIHKLVGGYALTILDTTWPHQITHYLRDMIQKWIVVAEAGREDTLRSALLLQRYLQERNLAAKLVVNKHRREMLKDYPHDLVLPYSTNPRMQQQDEVLGGPLLKLIYPQATPRRTGIISRLLRKGV